jgi:predicted aldo/keto reductase-like oxidoreductase
MGVILMRPLTSGVFQRLMAEAWAAGPAAIEIDVLDVGRLLLNYVLSDPYVDVALVGMREPRFVELNNEISDDFEARIDLAALHDRFRLQIGLGKALEL